MNELVTITGLSKTYGHFTALNNMNLVIPRGRIIGLLGPQRQWQNHLNQAAERPSDPCFGADSDKRPYARS